MAAKQLPSTDRLRQLLNYDSETGLLTWRESRTGTAKDGSIAGTVHKIYGYRRIGIDGVLHSAHRIAFKIYFYKDPSEHLDHINGSRDDNRICNLREATNSQNVASGKLGRISQSGKTGVYFIKRLGKYLSGFRKNKKYNYLGLFLTLEEAESAYNKEFKKAFGEFARKES